MSLSVLLGSAANSMLTACPSEPWLIRRTDSELDEKITLQLMDSHIDHGLLNPAFTAAVKDGRAVHPGRFSKNGQLKPGRLRELFEDGHTVNLRELQRTVPYLAELCHAIQDDTGYSLYVSAIITPPGRQGLRHHWDQFTGVITQMHGHKRWPIWRPEVELPMNDYLGSPVMWTQEMQDRWDSTEPYAVHDLGPGDTLVLPRGRGVWGGQRPGITCATVQGATSLGGCDGSVSFRRTIRGSRRSPQPLRVWAVGAPGNGRSPFGFLGSRLLPGSPARHRAGGAAGPVDPGRPERAVHTDWVWRADRR